MKIFKIFIPKGNMVNRQYKAQRNMSYIIQGTGAMQTLYEGGGYFLFGKPINHSNVPLGSAQITLGISLGYNAQEILRPTYLSILERAKNINLIRNIRQRHTNTAADIAMKLLTNG